MKLPDRDAPMCSSGKRPFRTEAEVAKELRAAQRSRSAGNTGYRPGSVEQGYYQCEACHWWHLRSSNVAPRRRDLGNRGRRR